GCKGSTSTDIITAAIYKAAADGAHIINLSLGGGPAFSTDSDAIAAQVVSKAGHFVVGAVGNDGLSGMFVSGNPGNSRGAIGVASFDNANTLYSKALVNGQSFAYSTAKSNGTISDGQIWDVVVNDPTADSNDILNDGCTNSSSLIHQNVTGKAILIRWGDASSGGSAKRCQYAANLGAAACILYGNNPSMVSILGVSTIPGIFLSQRGGRTLLSLLHNSSIPRIQITYGRTIEEISTAGTLSSFSSPGLNMELVMKPDISAIGGTVLSSMTPFAMTSQGIHGGNSGVMSGTSMATPYLAGILALILEIRGVGIGFEDARGYLQNYARPANLYNTSIMHSPAYQGAGLVDAYGACAGTTLVLPSSISLNDSVGFMEHQEVRVWNRGKQDAVYLVQFLVAGTVEPFVDGDDFMGDQNSTIVKQDLGWSVEFIDGSRAVVVGSGSNGTASLLLSVSAGENGAVSFRIIPPVSSELCRVYGGYLRFINTKIPDGGIGRVIHIPLVGVAGTWKDRPIWVRQSKSLASRVFNTKLNTSVSSVSSGIYRNLDFATIPQGSILNATEGIVVLAIAGMTSKVASVEVLKVGGGGVSLGYLNLVDFGPFSGVPKFSAHAAYWEPLQRTSFTDGQGVRGTVVYLWDGRVWEVNGNETSTDAVKPVKLVPGIGEYFWIRFKALRNFGDVGVDTDWDVISSALFTLAF
ncbi:UNVERIFIED_CONTAM: hypothetical protein HDU68_004163, partial [Siphonaria sp. JEL0065]